MTTQQPEVERRRSELELNALVERVEILDDDVRKLRHEFESHVLNEDAKYKEIKQSLDNLQKTVELLVVEIKEPLESYKTAKYGMAFIKWLVNTAKWVTPIVVALAIGYGYGGNLLSK